MYLPARNEKKSAGVMDYLVGRSGP